MPVNWSFLVGGHLASGFWTESLPGPESLILMSRFSGSTPPRSMQTPCRPDKRILPDSAFPTFKEGSRPSPAAAAEEVAVLLRGAVWIHHLFFGHRARRGNKRPYKPTDLEWSSFLPLFPPDTLVYQGNADQSTLARPRLRTSALRSFLHIQGADMELSSGSPLHWIFIRPWSK
jgi:hypothetical protein